MHVGTGLLKMNAYNYPDKLRCQDNSRALPLKSGTREPVSLSNALQDMGVGYGGRVITITAS